MLLKLNKLIMRLFMCQLTAQRSWPVACMAGCAAGREVTAWRAPGAGPPRGGCRRRLLRRQRLGRAGGKRPCATAPHVAQLVTAERQRSCCTRHAGAAPTALVLRPRRSRPRPSAAARQRRRQRHRRRLRHRRLCCAARRARRNGAWRRSRRWRRGRASPRTPAAESRSCCRSACWPAWRIVPPRCCCCC